MERRFIKERQREGIAHAKEQGVYKGGKRRLDYERVLAMHAQGHGPSAIAATFCCSRMQIYRILKRTAEAPSKSATHEPGAENRRICSP